jgi:(p)ppGpp synthase/HD superfamily hydrolase
MNTEQTEKAKTFASTKFKEVNITNHFLEVFTILKEDFDVADENVLTAGLLHDVLEDTNTTHEELVSTFSKEIADLVEEVSHPKNYNSAQKVQYYEKIKTISFGAKLIKMADFASHLKNFIEIYKRGEQGLHPKFVNNDKYIASIREFLATCEDSTGKDALHKLTEDLEKLL